jgi:hypothetical protein
MTYPFPHSFSVTNDDYDSAMKELRHELNGREPYAAHISERARALAERRYRHEKPTEPGLPPVSLESERITATDLGPIVIEEEDDA